MNFAKYPLYTLALFIYSHTANGQLHWGWQTHTSIWHENPVLVSSSGFLAHAAPAFGVLDTKKRNTHLGSWRIGAGVENHSTLKNTPRHYLGLKSAVQHVYSFNQAISHADPSFIKASLPYTLKHRPTLDLRLVPEAYVLFQDTDADGGREFNLTRVGLSAEGVFKALPLRLAKTSASTYAPVGFARTHSWYFGFFANLFHVPTESTRRYTPYLVAGHQYHRTSFNHAWGALAEASTYFDPEPKLAFTQARIGLFYEKFFGIIPWSPASKNIAANATTDTVATASGGHALRSAKTTLPPAADPRKGTLWIKGDAAFVNFRAKSKKAMRIQISTGATKNLRSHMQLGTSIRWSLLHDQGASDSTISTTLQHHFVSHVFIRAGF